MNLPSMFENNKGTDLLSCAVVWSASLVFVGVILKSTYGVWYLSQLPHSGKAATIRESNHGLGVCMEHYA